MTATVDTVVIGAGLAGACAAYALAQAGLSVWVLDAADGPAQGASALPVGLMAAAKGGHRRPAAAGQPDWDGAGMACTQRWLTQLSAQARLQTGQDWHPCGSAEYTGAGDWHWHPESAWIRPARFVAACLQQPGISCHYRQRITALVPQPHQRWQLQLADGHSLLAQRVVLAASYASRDLLLPLQTPAHSWLERIQRKHILKPSIGQAIYGHWQAAWQAHLPLAAHHGDHACNGQGHFIAAVPQPTGPALWLSGASYHASADLADVAQPAAAAQQQAAHIERLATSLPALAAAIHSAPPEQTAIELFTALRCTTPHTRPLVGALAPHLYLCAGLGSRGLSHAPLAAEFLRQCVLHDAASASLSAPGLG